MFDKAEELLDKITTDKKPLFNQIAKMYEKEEEYFEAEKAYEQAEDW
jgi:hypothetical protein